MIHAHRAINAVAKRLHAELVEAQRERWQREADECVRDLGITYYYGPRIAADLERR